MTGRPQVCTHEGCEKKPAARRLCSAHYQAAWKRGEFDNAPLPPRTPAPQVCPPDHKHGEKATCYVLHQCRCDGCRDSRTKREAKRRREIAYGTYDSGLVDAAPVRAHILALSEQGMGYKRVAKVAGLHVTSVRTLIWGRQDPGPRYGEIPKRTTKAKAAAILAVVADDETLARGALVDPTSTRRRVQALVARGWSFSKIAERLDVEVRNFLVSLQREHVQLATKEKVAALYEQLWNVEPPRASKGDARAFTMSKRLADARGYLPPMAWDDIDTDPAPPAADGEAFLDEGAIALAVEGEKPMLRVEERREVVRILHRERWSDARIGQHIGSASKTVMLDRQALGLEAFEQTELVRARRAS